MHVKNLNYKYAINSKLLELSSDFCFSFPPKKETNVYYNLQSRFNIHRILKIKIILTHFHFTIL